MHGRALRASKLGGTGARHRGRVVVVVAVAPGGKAAIEAAVEALYVKVLADNRIKHYFEDINMTKQRRKQKEFLAATLG